MWERILLYFEQAKLAFCDTDGPRLKQRVLNDLQRARLSRGRMNWFLARPAPPPPSTV
jgi:hypothetical protein